jgi:hypothetical protein
MRGSDTAKDSKVAKSCLSCGACTTLGAETNTAASQEQRTRQARQTEARYRRRKDKFVSVSLFRWCLYRGLLMDINQGAGEGLGIIVVCLGLACIS